MDVDGWLAALAHSSDSLVEVARAGSLDAPVAACPGWSVRDLVGHVAEVLGFWTTVVRDEIDDPELIERSPRPADGEIAAWLERNAAEAQRVLSTSDPGAPCWTWSHQHDVRFVIRRMAQEVAVHAWDGRDAVGRRGPIEAELASDGIDEFLDHFASWPAPDRAALGGTVHLHCTDVAGEWLVRQDGDRLAFTREHAKGSCAIRGAASDLLLVLWRRLALDAVEVIGDRDVAGRFVAFTGMP